MSCDSNLKTPKQTYQQVLLPWPGTRQGWYSLLFLIFLFFQLYRLGFSKPGRWGDQLFMYLLGPERPAITTQSEDAVSSLDSQHLCMMLSCYHCWIQSWFKSSFSSYVIWIISTDLTSSLFSCPQSTDKPIKRILHCSFILFQEFTLNFFLIVSIVLLLKVP